MTGVCKRKINYVIRDTYYDKLVTGLSVNLKN